MIFLQNTADKSCEGRTLFQIHQNLLHDIEFLPQHLPYSVCFCQLKKKKKLKGLCEDPIKC